MNITVVNKISSLNEVETGDDFLVRGSSFLSRSICHVMVKWGKQKGYDLQVIALVMSHAAKFVRHTELPDTPFLYGSTESGYKPLEFERHYSWDEDEFIIMRKVGGLSSEQKSKVLRFVIHLVTVSIMYQYWNLIQWLLLVYLHINTFTWDSEDFNYCYESCYLTRRELNPEDYPSTKNPDIFQLILGKGYEIIHYSKKLKESLGVQY